MAMVCTGDQHARLGKGLKAKGSLGDVEIPTYTSSLETIP